ncbi:hypothetical protein FJN13_15525 [Alteromonas mediterranea]|uniref:hypothetical protein n=1 Tax=Alteromonas mediterranea TaxID=314275 RepID=UPI0011306270|nr:hypothetical protein [Alteromonas mediterranea]QDG36134.1 hypothetical protein FJN13_15525 [Alteromonas mediterranea]
MLKHLTSAVVTALLLSACSEPQDVVITPEPQDLTEVTVGGWILDQNGRVMFDPQTSGLVELDGELVTIADASADVTQQLKLHTIAPETATLSVSSERFSFARSVRRSCFFSYLSEQPDLEALAVDPRNTDVIYTVTEDATRTGALSPRCETKYEDTGSTDYPTLLVKLTRKDNGTVEMSNVRPLQFPLELEVGNFPNDGIEGLAMADDGTLYLGLEKDKAGQPRIFSLNVDDGFFESRDFAAVSEPSLQLPRFTSGNHPINGLTFYTHTTGASYLLGAARNDNELWVIDVSGKKPTKRIPITFDVAGDENCEQYTMDNASMEGVVVIKDTLWIINDPWEKNYLKNATCDAHLSRYEDLAPLLFPLKINDMWFK